MSDRRQAYLDYLSANLAEDAGHMGWTRDDYPGCPERRKAAKQMLLEQYENISAQFDEAGHNEILDDYEDY